MKFFFDRGKVRPDKNLFVGIERECFLTREGKIVPISPEVVAKIDDKIHFRSLLSACQLEMRTDPTPLEGVSQALTDSDKLLREYEQSFNLHTLPQQGDP